MLCGSRFLKDGSSNTFFRHICSLIFNKFINLLTKGKLSDNLSGFFIIKKKFLKMILIKSFMAMGSFILGCYSIKKRNRN